MSVSTSLNVGSKRDSSQISGETSSPSPKRVKYIHHMPHSALGSKKNQSSISQLNDRLNEKSESISDCFDKAIYGTSSRAFERIMPDDLDVGYIRCVEDPNLERAKNQYEKAQQLWQEEAYQQALRLYSQSALQGSREAIDALNVIYEDDHKKIGQCRSSKIWGDFLKRRKTALNHLIGHFEANKNYEMLFALYILRSKHKKSELFFTKMGIMCLRGRGIKKDVKRGLSYLEKNVDFDPIAVKALRKYYRKKGDLQKVFHYFEILAEHDAHKAYRLGKIYERGQYYGYFFSPDLEKAGKFYLQSIEQFKIKDEENLEKFVRKTLTYASEEKLVLLRALLCAIEESKQNLSAKGKIYLLLGSLIPNESGNFYQLALQWGNRSAHYMIGNRKADLGAAVQFYIKGMKMGCPMASQALIEAYQKDPSLSNCRAHIMSEAYYRLALSISSGEPPDLPFYEIEQRREPAFEYIGKYLNYSAAHDVNTFLKITEEVVEQNLSFHFSDQLLAIFTNCKDQLAQLNKPLTDLIFEKYQPKLPPFSPKIFMTEESQYLPQIQNNTTSSGTISEELLHQIGRETDPGMGHFREEEWEGFF